MSTRTKERILIIDDQKVFRKKLELAVAHLNYEASSAESGQLGLDRLRKENFDLLLLDIMMPGMDGVRSHAVHEAGSEITRHTNNCYFSP